MADRALSLVERFLAASEADAADYKDIFGASSMEYVSEERIALRLRRLVKELKLRTAAQED